VKSKLRRMSALSVAAVSFAAVCDGGSANAASAKNFVAFSMPFQDTTGVATINKGARDAAKAEGLNLLETTFAESDPAKQVTQINTSLIQGAAGLIVMPTDSAAIAPALDAAETQSVPVVAIDTSPTRGKVVITVRANNYQMAADVCGAMGKLLGGKGKVLVIQGNLAVSNGRDRSNGFTECAAKTYPGIDVIARPADWVGTKAADIAQTVLAANPDLAGIYLSTDCNYIEPVKAVMKAAARLAPAGQPGHIVVGAIDGCPQGLAAIRDGYLDVLAQQPLLDYGKYGIQYLEAAVRRNTSALKVGPTAHSSVIVEIDGNLQDQLAAPLVTKVNVDDRALWANNLKN
jgi:ribose transport system substrate-binding protein